MRESLTALERRLGPKRFVRIHRSTIVRRDRIQALKPRSHGDATAVLADGTELRVSRTYRERLVGFRPPAD